VKGKIMNIDIIQGKWKQLTGTIEAKLGEMTDDDLTQLEGEIEKLQGLIQERFGDTKEEVKDAT
jgi:uncharacterized protein YjbJ (UPF0337 family)